MIFGELGQMTGGIRFVMCARAPLARLYFASIIKDTKLFPPIIGLGRLYGTQRAWRPAQPGTLGYGTTGTMASALSGNRL